MSHQTCHACLGNHAHFQMGAENIGVVIQNRLLHLYRQLTPALCIKSSCHLRLQRFQLIGMVMAVIDRGAVQAMGGKEIFRITGGRCNHGAGIDVPGGRILADAVVIGRTVDGYVDSNILQGRLYGFGQKGQLLTAGIGQPTDGQLRAILFPDAIAVTICPACVLKHLLRALRIVAA